MTSSCVCTFLCVNVGVQHRSEDNLGGVSHCLEGSPFSACHLYKSTEKTGRNWHMRLYVASGIWTPTHWAVSAVSTELLRLWITVWTLLTGVTLDHTPPSSWGFHSLYLSCPSFYPPQTAGIWLISTRTRRSVKKGWIRNEGKYGIWQGSGVLMNRSNKNPERKVE